MAYSEQDFLDGLAAGLAATAGNLIPPRKRFVALVFNVATSGIPPLLAGIGYQGDGKLFFGYRIEYDAGTNGGAIEEVDHHDAYIANPSKYGYWYDYLYAVGPWIRGDIAGARMIPTYWSEDPRHNAKAPIVARAGAIEFAESVGEWSINGNRDYGPWIDPEQMFGEPWHVLPSLTIVNYPL